MEPVLKIENLRTSFMTSNGEVQAVRGVSFQVNKGEILGIVGESGSGKSVTSMSVLRLLADTAVIKDGSSILFEGRDLIGLTKKELRKIRGEKISMVFQDPMSSLNPLIPVGKQVSEMMKEHHPEMTKQQLQEATLKLFEEVRIQEPEKRLLHDVVRVRRGSEGVEGDTEYRILVAACQFYEHRSLQTDHFFLCP